METMTIVLIVAVILIAYISRVYNNCITMIEGLIMT